MTCAQAKIRRQPTPRDRQFGDPATYVGRTVSADVKYVPFESLNGYKYVFGACYFMRSKDEADEKFQWFVELLGRYSHRVTRFQTDRGSEFSARKALCMLIGRDLSVLSISIVYRMGYYIGLLRWSHMKT